MWADAPEGHEVVLEMVITYLAGYTGEPANELRRKLDTLSDEERKVLIAYLSTPAHPASERKQ